MLWYSNHILCGTCNQIYTSPFQNVGHFNFFKFIVFVMHLDIIYIQIHNKIYESRKVKTAYILVHVFYSLMLCCFEAFAAHATKLLHVCSAANYGYLHSTSWFHILLCICLGPTTLDAQMHPEQHTPSPLLQRSTREIYIWIE